MAQNLKGVRFPGLPEPYLIPQIDPSLTQPGFSADAETTGKALADRLPATHLNAETQHVADEADFNAKVIELYNTLLNGTIGRYCFSINGAIWFVSIYKADIDYGVFEMVQYSASGVRIRHASMFEGAFTGWVNPTIDGSTILTEANWPQYIKASGSGGMSEEFDATQSSGTNNNKISKSGDTYTFTTQGNLSKLYSLTVRCIGVNGTDDPDALVHNGFFNSFVVGWKQIVAACTNPSIGVYAMAVPCYNPTSGFEGVVISAGYDSSTGNITFQLTSKTWEFYHIRGLY